MLTVGRRTGGAGLEPGCVGAGLSQWSPKILPAPSCYVFTMVLVDRGYVDMWICVGVVLDTSVLSTNRRKLPFYINEIYIKLYAIIGFRQTFANI